MQGAGGTDYPSTFDPYFDGDDVEVSTDASVMPIVWGCLVFIGGILILTSILAAIVLAALPFP